MRAASTPPQGRASETARFRTEFSIHFCERPRKGAATPIRNAPTHRAVYRSQPCLPARPQTPAVLASELLNISHTPTLIDAALRVRNTNTHPDRGSDSSRWRHTAAKESMPLRPSTTSGCAEPGVVWNPPAAGADFLGARSHRDARNREALGAITSVLLAHRVRARVPPAGCSGDPPLVGSASVRASTKARAALVCGCLRRLSI